MRRSIFVVAVAALAVAGGLWAQTMSPASSGVVPVVSRTPGAMGSTWSTNVYITQVTGNAPATVNLTVHAVGGAARSLAVALPGAAGSAEVLDVVSAAGVAADGNYVMTWWSTQPVVLSTRTFTTEASGSYGQGISSVADGSGFATGGTVIFPAPMDAGNHRVNVGIANAGPATQSFHLEAIGVDGSVGSSWDLEVGPYAVEQLRANAGMTTAGSVSVSCSRTATETHGYASVVVNDFNDAYFLYAAQARARSCIRRC
jgi:hypothetical protein